MGKLEIKDDFYLNGEIFHGPNRAEFNFEVDRNICRFIRIAQELGLWVIIRPSHHIVLHLHPLLSGGASSLQYHPFPIDCASESVYHDPISIVRKDVSS